MGVNHTSCIPSPFSPATTVLIAATAYEIKLVCENLDDLDELYRELGMEAVDGGLMADVCHPELPSVDELMGAVEGYL